MRTLLVVATLSALLLPASAQKFAPNVVTDKPLAPADQAKAFILPEGFEIQLVASEPDIQKPMNLAFDARGRLWVTGSVEYPWPAKGEARDEVRILEDFAPEGKARKITTFAKGLNIPIGLLPVGDDDALVYSISNIQRITPKGREKLYTGYGFADTHGMTSAFTPGFDGWIYACHGFSNTSDVKGKNPGGIKMQSGNTYRMKADGSKIEQHTWGQVNPFGLSFDALGNLYSADCHTQPIYQLLRGGWYPSFGKPHDGLGFAPEMITGFKGSTAIAGVAVYEADQFPMAYRGSAFVGDVMTNELLRFEIRHEGSTPVTKAVPFLRSKDQWFRPVDVKLGPDGALYIADFYNCIIGHYEVPLNHPARDRTRGRIWRIVHKDKGTPGRADFLKATTKDLISDLGHPNLTVRLTATNQLAGRGKEASDAVRAALRGKTTPEANAHLLWAAYRLDVLTAEDTEAALKREDEIVRVHACRVLAERGGQRELLTKALEDASPNVRRAAAEALGRHPSPGTVTPLLKLLQSVPAKDTHLRHVVRMALRDQLVSGDAWAVAGRLSDRTDIAAIGDVALGRHSADAAAWIAGRLKELGHHEKFVHHAARHGDEGSRTNIRNACSGDFPPQREAGLVRAYFRATQERGAAPEKEAVAWAEGVAEKLFDSSRDADAQAGAELCGQARLASKQAKLVGIAGSARGVGPRLAALNALAAIDGPGNAKVIGAALTDTTLSLADREQIAVILGRINQPATRAAMVAALATAPARLQTAIAANLSAGKEGAEELFKAVAAGKASARLLQERAVTTRLEAARVPDLAAKLKNLTAGMPAADARLAAMIEARRKGYLAAKPDLAKGAALFEKHCAGCHQVEGKGAKIGPQLDGIGLRGLERLLEDTLDPNRNVDQAFRATTINTGKGIIFQGLVLREEGEVIVMADDKGKEVRVQKRDVETRTLSNLSPMPANFGETVPEADFHHLIGWLLSKRPARP